MSLSGIIALPYGARLLCLCLATGAAGYAAGAAAVEVATPGLLRRLRARQNRAPEMAARQALRLRMLPLALAALAALVLCVPSYLWLEPRHRGPEAMSWMCCALALAGAGLAGWMLLRLAQLGVASWCYSLRVRRQGRRQRVGGAWVRVLAAPAPAMAVSGWLRPQLSVSQPVLAGLSEAELEAGLEHERAHVATRDNLKRLLLAAAPLAGGKARALERRWARMVEWAADDRAAGASPERSLALAEALVAVAKLGTAPECSLRAPWVLTLAGQPGPELAERIARLLAHAGEEGRTAAPPRRQWLGYAVLAAVLWATLQPTTLMAAHVVLERLVH
ncbi:MAG: hypothetical protein ACRD04_11310 [Terriglobales bacterium]